MKPTKDLLCVLAPVDELREVQRILRHQQKLLAGIGIDDVAGRSMEVLVTVLLSRPRRVARLGDVVGLGTRAGDVRDL